MQSVRKLGLLRRMAHLRTMLRYTQDDRIVLSLKKFIADTELKLVNLNT
jgi:hypothetical protein